MAIVVCLDQERLPWAADGETLELTQDANGAWQSWLATLLLCLRDKASSVHYHSRRGDDAFSCVVAGTRYTLVPPPPGVADHMATAWRDRISRSLWQRLRRLVWPTGTEASVVCTTIGGMAFDWDLVCWSLPDAFGVDLYLLSLEGRLAQPQEAEPSAASQGPRDGPLGMKFVPLPKATFWWHGGGEPGTWTEITEDFEIAIHTVTQGQWQKVMGDNPSWFSRDGEGKDKVKDIKDEDLKHFPVEMVSWNDAQAFIKKLNKKEKGNGYAYRLPSDAEWEYARRGGRAVADFSYLYYLAEPTNDLSSRDANFDGGKPGGNADMGPKLGRTAKVGSYAPNEIGLYDMHGNVTQWCADSVPVSDYLIAVLGSELALEEPFRVTTGTSWDGGADGSGTISLFRDAQQNFLGFRLVRVPIR